ncbi:hypothetical protein IEO21_03550 [Rhodonia placenta]|uniref:Uncharacterized protein n=1 Tax=Rhodonia placenta TaxID=104341 RepID=A0A8H7P5N1_9APHY|nr:hypothetical protein IEO21_03550 [Postia placenta]
MDGEISDSLPTLSVMYPVVFSDLRATFKRASERKIHQCSMDLCLIALCVRYGKLIYDSHRVVWIEQGRYHLWVDRTGYLFDAFVPSVSHTTTPAQTFAGLLIKLREIARPRRAPLAIGSHKGKPGIEVGLALTKFLQKLPAFNNVVLVQEPQSAQLFFVNAALLRERCSLRDPEKAQQPPGCATDPWMPAPPARVLAALAELCRDSLLARTFPPTANVVLSLSPTLEITDIVPLAAYLLEYPVAYVPCSEGQTSFLAGAALDVYECTFQAAEAHILLKFSCPSGIGELHPELSAGRLAESLRHRFGLRLRAAGLPDNLIVQHHTKTYDRVSL